MPFVYAATMAGAHVRLWTCRRDQTAMIPFWGPSSGGGDWSQYKDVGDDKAGQEIEYWFGQMKRLPPTPHAGQNSYTYGIARFRNSCQTTKGGALAKVTRVFWVFKYRYRLEVCKRL